MVSGTTAIEGGDNGSAISPSPEPMALPSSTFPLLPTTTRKVQISPETTSSTTSSSSSTAHSSDAPTADKFSRIVPRPLGHRGVCKVMLVDDSRVNVNVMKKMLNRVSATWLWHPPLPSSSSVVVAAAGSPRRRRRLSSNGRSNIYMFEEEEEGEPVVSSSPRTSSGALSSQLTEAVRFDYSEADDGLVAVQAVQAASDVGVPFDIVFMDNIMVLMHGPEAAQAMRTAGFEGLIVGVTGNVMADDVNQYLASGADYVLGKPVNMEDLKQILNRLTN